MVLSPVITPIYYLAYYLIDKDCLALKVGTLFFVLGILAVIVYAIRAEYSYEFSSKDPGHSGLRINENGNAYCPGFSVLYFIKMSTWIQNCELVLYCIQ